MYHKLRNTLNTEHINKNNLQKTTLDCYFVVSFNFLQHLYTGVDSVIHVMGPLKGSNHEAFESSTSMVARKKLVLATSAMTCTLKK